MPESLAVPDLIAIDAKGYGWRVWDDQEMWSMVPVNPDNSPIPKPIKWFVPAHKAEVDAVMTAMTTKGYERLMELVRPEDFREALACLKGIVCAVVSGGPTADRGRVVDRD